MPGPVFTIARAYIDSTRRLFAHAQIIRERLENSERHPSLKYVVQVTKKMLG